MIKEVLMITAVVSTLGFLYTQWSDYQSLKAQESQSQDKTLNKLKELKGHLEDTKKRATGQQAELNGLTKSVEALGNLARNSSISVQELDGDIDKLQEHLAFLREKMVALESKVETHSIKISKPIPIYVVKDQKTRVRSKSIYKKVIKNGKEYWIKETETRRVKKKGLPGVEKAKDAFKRAGL